MSALESWFAPAAVAEPLPKPRQRRRALAPPRPKARQQRPRLGFRVRSSVVWMVAFAVLLVGVVAVNVAVLRAHVSVNDLDTKIVQLQQENATLAGRYSSLKAAPRVEAAAHRADLVLAPSTSPIDLGSRK
jgi:cell division protein FtsL